MIDLEIKRFNPQQYIAEAEEKRSKGGKNMHVQPYRKSGKPFKAGYWPQEKKLQVCTLFASGVTSSADLERLTGVPESSVRRFRHEEWWPEMLEQVYAAMDQETESKQTKVINKTLDLIQDRLEGGDYILSRDGEIRRKPINGRELSQIHTAVVDKRQLLRQRSVKKDTTTAENRLEKLAKDFTKFLKAKDITGESTHVKEDKETTQDAVSEQEVLNATSSGTEIEVGSTQEETQGQTV